MIKRWIIAVLAVMTMLCTAAAVSAEEALYIDFDAETGTIKNVFNPPKDVYEIPAYIDGVPVRVVKLDGGYDHELDYVDKLIIPETVEKINFSGYYRTLGSLEIKEDNPYITIEDNVLYSKDKKILLYCLSEIRGSFTIPEGVETITDGAFTSLQNLTEIKIPGSVSVIEDGAFDYCGVEKITLSAENNYFVLVDDVLLTKDMKEIVWFPKTKKGSYTIPESVEKIRYKAFYNCAISEINFSDNITDIGEWAFAHSDNLSLFVLPPKITEVKSHTFSYMYSPYYVIIPEGVTSIGYMAFHSDCTVYIPQSVTDINIGAFESNATLYVHENSAAHKFALKNDIKFEFAGDMTSDDIEEIFTQKAFEILCEFYPNGTGNIDYISNIRSDVLKIPDTVGNVTVTSVLLNDYYTEDGNPIKKMIIPDTVKIAGYSSAANYEIEISENNEYMTVKDGIVYSKDMKTLIYCLDDIEGELTVPVGVETISDYAFTGQIKISKLSLPKTLQNLSGLSFSTGAFISEITINEDNEKYTVVDNVIFSKDMNTIYCCPGFRKGSYTIPEGVEYIFDNAFYYSELSEIVLPDSVQKIGDNAFNSCRNLKTISLPSGITEIPYGTFEYSGLENVIIPDTVTSIGESAFLYTDLTKVNIPDSVTTIGESAFAMCFELNEVHIPPSVTSIGEWAFNSGDYPVIFVEYGSAAHQYAIENHNPYIITGSFIISMQIDNPVMNVGGTDTTLDVPPMIINDRTMVPLRAIFEALGAEVQWDGDTRTITGTKGDTTITMQIDNLTMTKNGVESTLDTPPQIVNDRTLVPVRAISESFGCDVAWDGDTRTVTITVK